MPLSHHHQMSVLKDILSNHQADCSGTTSECEQVERLATSLIGNTNVNNDVKTVLTNIHDYSTSGQSAEDVNSHIHSHNGNLSQWIESMDNYT